MDQMYVHIRSAQPPHFFRAGRKWPYDGVVVAASIFTADEVEALENEPKLVIRPATEDEIAEIQPAEEPDDSEPEKEPDGDAPDEAPKESAGDDQPAEASEDGAPRVPPLADPEEGRCIATTSNGDRCRLPAREGYQTCHQHKGQEPAPEDEPENNEE